MNPRQNPFYKGIAGFTREREDDYWREAEQGVYGWWWRYLRLSPVFWYSRTTGLAPKHPQLAKTMDEAGDLSHDNFTQWWRDTGSSLYVEEDRPRRVRLVNESNLAEFVFYPKGKSIVVEIPLTIRQTTINSQIRQLLVEHHAGRSLDVMAHSTAKWPLHTKRYSVDTLRREYWTLLYRMLYPGIATWRIGDRLRLAPGLNLRDKDRWKLTRSTSPLERLASTIGRYLYKAKWTLRHAEQGSFPNATKAPPVQYPFGKRVHDEFLEATGDHTNMPSPWRTWLHNQHHEDLVMLVRKKNNLIGMAAIHPRTQALLPKFIAGETDLIA